MVRSKGEGDSTFSVFAEASDAARAAVEVQRALQREPWPDGAAIRVRAALYTGNVQLREGDYYGVTPNRCARLRAATNPGQVVCSQSTADALAACRRRSSRPTWDCTACETSPAPNASSNWATLSCAPPSPRFAPSRYGTTCHGSGRASSAGTPTSPRSVSDSRPTVSSP